MSVQIGALAPVVYGYDTQGRVDAISQTDGATTRTVTFGYHATHGWLETITDAQNRTTTFQRDAVGRILQQIAPNTSEVLAFTYDEAGNVTSVTPPSRPAHDFYFDSADRLREYDPPNVSGVTDPQTEYNYTLDHDLDLTSLPTGSNIDFSHDPVTGKLASVLTPEADYHFMYDDDMPGETGRLESVLLDDDDMSIGMLTLTYEYDGDLVTEEALTGAVAGTVSWGYDGQMRVDEETVQSDTVAYGYDAQGRLTTVGAMSATYVPTTGQLETTTLGDVDTAVSYDGFGDVSGVLYEANNSPVYGVSYTRDALGRVETKTEKLGGATRLRCYEYDVSDRLETVSDGADSNGCSGSVLEAYSYDLNGNRASVTNSAGTIAAVDIVTDGQDRLLEHGDFTYTYNEDGQMETRTQRSGRAGRWCRRGSTTRTGGSSPRRPRPGSRSRSGSPAACGTRTRGWCGSGRGITGQRSGAGRRRTHCGSGRGTGRCSRTRSPIR